jgi:hypothetical protein
MVAARSSFPKMQGFHDQSDSDLSVTVLYLVIYFPSLHPTLRFPYPGIDGLAKYCHELLAAPRDHIIHVQLQCLDKHKVRK